MFRRWLSGFWRDNKEKIMQIAKVCGILIAIGASAGVIFSTLNLNNGNQNNTVSKVYTPEKTVISGDNIKEEEFEKENNLAETFVNLCNDQKIEEAYNLLTDECKEKLYPTMQDFKEKYYDIIFKEDRIFSLQSWVNNKNYNTYKISYTGDFMATGVYDGTEKFEDYITIVTDKDNEENKKINVNNYIKTEEINKTTKTENLEVEVLSCDTYMEYVTYKLRVKNITDKNIVLDNLNKDNGIKLKTANGGSYKVRTTNLKRVHLEINAEQQKYITLSFDKRYGEEKSISSIDFENAILDYSKYSENKDNYNEYKKISIRF